MKIFIILPFLIQSFFAVAGPKYETLQSHFFQKINSSIGQQVLMGDWAGNGGGIAEENILYALLHLDTYISTCLNTKNCKTTAKEKNILRAIKRTLPQELMNPNIIQFLSEHKNPGTFIIDGELKIAKTGNKVSQTIFINTDLLYSETFGGSKKAMSINEAVTLLIHEFGHHHFNGSSANNPQDRSAHLNAHLELDYLGLKVSRLLGQMTDRASLFPHDNSIMAIALNTTSETDYTQLLIYVDDQIINASEALEKEVKCPVIRGIDILNRKSYGAIFHNLYWSKFKKLRLKRQTYKFKLRGSLTILCKSKLDSSKKKQKMYQASISFKMKKVKKGHETKWKYIENSLNVNQIHDAWWMILKLPRLPLLRQ